MQKKLIAAAVAGLVSGAAFAQSNVTIYGIADAYYGNIKATGNKTLNVVNSGGLSASRIGFKGTESLGNGLTALFVLEYGLSVDKGEGTAAAQTWTETTGVPVGVTGSNSTSNNGSGIGAARQQLVGLTGGFGTFVAGRAQTTGYDFSVGGYNALAGSVLDPHAEVSVGTLITTSSRADNAVAYISPNFSGFTFAVNHSRVSEAAYASNAAGKDSTANLLSATYENGPLKVGYVYSKVNDAGDVAGTDVKENALGASYDFKVAKVGIAWQDTKTTGAAKNKSWLLSAAAPVGNGTLAFTYAKQDLDGVNDDENAYGVAYLYPLSKRTTVYGGYERVSDNGNTNGATQKTLGLGVRHSF